MSPRGAFATGALAVACASPALPACAQRLGQAASVDVPLWRIAGALVICLSLAVGAAFALRSRLRGGAPVSADGQAKGPLGLFDRGKRRLQLVESLRLSHQVDVCLLRVDETEVVIAATPHGAVVVCPGGLANPKVERP